MKGKLKKWLLPLLLVLAVVMPAGVSASMNLPTWANSQNQYLVLSNGDVTYYGELAYSTGYWYVDSNNNIAGSSTFNYSFSYDGGVTWNSKSSNQVYGFVDSSYSVMQGNSNIYSDFDKSGFFFSAQPEPVKLPETGAVDKTTLEALGAILSQHGMTVLLGALVILTLMLGIYSVPRLVRWLAR